MLAPPPESWHPLLGEILDPPLTTLGCKAHGYHMMVHWREKCIPYNMSFTTSLSVNPPISGEQLKISKHSKFENMIMA